MIGVQAAPKWFPRRPGRPPGRPTRSPRRPGRRPKRPEKHPRRPGRPPGQPKRPPRHPGSPPGRPGRGPWEPFRHRRWNGDRSGIALESLGIRHLTAQGSPAGDKGGYNYPLGVVKSSKEVNIDLIRRWAEGQANVSFSTQASYPNGMLFKRCVDDNVSGSEIEPHITLLG